jgi:hypothetical protein
VLPGGAPDDDAKRFLRELRQLRDMAGLGLAELAARAHYPHDVLQSAEAGPGLPDLPVLSAYVRGCGGTAAEWEERWRSLTRSPASPLLPTRTAGDSDAATAGARIGTTATPPDGHDSARILAALDRVADGMAAAPAAESSLPGPSGTPGSSGTPGTPGTPGSSGSSGTPGTPGSAVPGMRLSSAPDAAQPASAAGATPAAAPGLPRHSAAGTATGAVGSRSGVASAPTVRTAHTGRPPAGHARGTITPRAIAAGAAIALLVVLILIFVL